MTIGLLGPLEVSVGDSLLAVGGSRPRAVLALLALEPGRVVSAERLVDAMWGSEAPERAVNTLQVHVSNLRRSLVPIGDALGIDDVIVTRAPGYLLNVPPGTVDVERVDRAVRVAMESAATDPESAASLLRDALSWWRGPALGDLVEFPFHQSMAVRLSSKRKEAFVAWCEIELALGRHGSLVQVLQEEVAADPFDERLCALTMLALYRSGRQADALAEYRRLRLVLAEELGLDPSAEVQRLERQILEQDPQLSLRVLDPQPESVTILRSSIVVVPVRLEVDGVVRDLEPFVTTIGRRYDQHIVIDDARVSRQHAEVRIRPDGVWLVDKGSTNGTRLNGEPVVSAQLQHEDRIEIGDSVLRVLLS